MAITLDKKLPYATITGHEIARYEQGGMLFDGAGQPIPDKKLKAVEKDRIIETDDVENAKTFLCNVLKSGPLSKSVVFKVAEENNQSWDSIKKASALMGLVTFTYNKATMWKLPEELVGA